MSVLSATVQHVVFPIMVIQGLLKWEELRGLIACFSPSSKPRTSRCTAVLIRSYVPFTCVSLSCSLQAIAMGVFVYRSYKVCSLYLRLSDTVKRVELENRL